MTDYAEQSNALKLLSSAQEAEKDNRERAKIVTDFIEKDDGQWEPEIVNKMSGRPRYTFDKCNPVVDSIAGEIEQADFSIKVRPSGGNATEDIASIYDGLIRNIQSMSSATDIYNASGRKMVKCGFDAWRVKHDWIDDDSFEQDLVIKKIANAIDRVWFDENMQEQNGSDAFHCFLLHAMTKDKYKDKYPDATLNSISNTITKQVYYFKPDFVIFAEILYKKSVSRKLVQMTNGEVYEVDEKFNQIKDELSKAGINVHRERNRESHIVHSRFFNNDDWLGDEHKTVFSYLPIIPVFGNFDVVEDKVIYRGAINKLMDSQRVYNYAQSRQIEEGALAPREKYWMTKEQAVGHEAKLRTMNTNADPVQFYNHKEGHVPPYKTGGATINQGLVQTAADMKQNVTEASGIFAANQGDAPNQSGYAIELQQNKGDNSTIKYHTSQRIAITHTGRVIIDAIPRVYDSERMIRILGEDGKAKMQKINVRTLTDEQTKQVVKINDLSQGKYDLVCDIGPAFKNRQQETAKAFIDVAGIDPTIIQDGKDIWLNNLPVPGMDAMAERARKKLLEAGVIPDSQMTDEEKEHAKRLIEQAQQQANQGPTPTEQAILAQTQAQVDDTNSRIDERLAKIHQADRKLELEEMRLGIQQQNNTNQLLLKQNMQIVEALNTQAQTLKTLQEAFSQPGSADSGISGNVQNQSDIVDKTQSQQ